MKHFQPTTAAVMKARVAAALANNPAIKPSELSRQTGLTLGASIALLDGKANS